MALLELTNFLDRPTHVNFPPGRLLIFVIFSYLCPNPAGHNRPKTFFLKIFALHLEFYLTLSLLYKALISPLQLHPPPLFPPQLSFPPRLEDTSFTNPQLVREHRRWDLRSSWFRVVDAFYSPRVGDVEQMLALSSIPLGVPSAGQLLVKSMACDLRVHRLGHPEIAFTVSVTSL